MNLDINEIRSYLDALVGVDHIYELLKERYPQNLADIVSSRENPNCGCRNRLSGFLIEQYNNPSESDFIKKLLSDPKVIERATQIQKIVEQNQRQQIPQGQQQNPSNIRKYTLSKAQTGWDAFAEWIDSKQIQFKSFSVVDRGNELDVYFL
jgi:hypothetical protein